MATLVSRRSVVVAVGLAALFAAPPSFGYQAAADNRTLELSWQRPDLATFVRVEEVLAKVGRMKYLKPLYAALAQTETGKTFARACFSKLRAGYHPIARQVVEALLA